jgi:hypothetical protein
LDELDADGEGVGEETSVRPDPAEVLPHLRARVGDDVVDGLTRRRAEGAQSPLQVAAKGEPSCGVAGAES